MPASTSDLDEHEGSLDKEAPADRTMVVSF